MRALLTFLFAVLLSTITWANTPVESEFNHLLEENKNKVIYIDFWASWCIPCRQSFPWMNNMQEKYKAQGLTIISINLDQDKINADEFLAEIPSNFPVLFDPKGKLAKKFKLKGMPNSFIINRQGELVSKHVGFNDEKKIQFEEEIIHLLNAN